MRSINRLHERRSFFKYMPFDTAKIVLANTSLRWSSPIIFNDPFDVPRELLPDINEEHISRALAQKLVTELKNPRDNFNGINLRLRGLLELFQRAFPQGLTPEQIADFANFVANPPVGAGASVAINELKELWRVQLEGRRILCLSESPLILPMWNHYAHQYTGIVLEFACEDELESAWLRAKPIDYTDEKPLTYSAEGMAELLFLEDGSGVKYLNDKITYIKTTAWAYEHEWRVSSYKRAEDAGLYSDFRFHPLELKSIILGPQFDMTHLEHIIELSQQYPNSRIQQTTLNARRDIFLEPV